MSDKNGLEDLAGQQKHQGITKQFTEPDQEILTPLILEDSEAYAKEAGITPRC